MATRTRTAKTCKEETEMGTGRTRKRDKTKIQSLKSSTVSRCAGVGVCAPCIQRLTPLHEGGAATPVERRKSL